MAVHQGLALEHQNRQVDNLGSKARLLQDWQSMMNHSLIGDMELKKNSMKSFWKHKDLWRRHLEIIKAKHNTVDMKEGTWFIHQQLYRARQGTREVLFEHLDKHLKAGVVKVAQSEWASLVVVVPKSNGIFQFSENYWRPEVTTVPRTNPLSFMDVCIDSLEDAQMFTAMDALWGNSQVPFKEKDKDKTTLNSHLCT